MFDFLGGSSTSAGFSRICLESVLGKCAYKDVRYLLQTQISGSSRACCLGTMCLGNNAPHQTGFYPTNIFLYPIFFFKTKKKEQERNPYHSLLLFSCKLQILSIKPPSFLDGLRDAE